MGGFRLTHEQWVKRFHSLYGNKYKVLSEYINSTSQMKLSCNSCNLVWYACANDLRGRSGCPDCGNTRKGQYRKISTEEHQKAIDKVFGRDKVQLLGAFKGTSAKNFYRGLCGHTYLKLPGDLLKSSGMCHNCGSLNKVDPRHKNNEKHQAELDTRFNRQLRLVGDYAGSFIAVEYACACGDQRMRRPHDVLSASYPCPRCARSRTFTPEQRASAKEFRRMVGSITRTHYMAYKALINPSGLGRGYHLDHNYSVFDAFHNSKNLKNPITLSEVCHPANLSMLTQAENLQKKHRSSVSASRLRQLISAWNREHGKTHLVPVNYLPARRIRRG